MELWDSEKGSKRKTNVYIYIYIYNVQNNFNNIYRGMNSGLGRGAHFIL